MKLETILLARNALVNLSEQTMPIALAFKIGLLIERMKPFHESFETQRVALVKELGVQLPDGTINVPAYRMEDFQNAVNDVMKVECDFSATKLSLESFPDHVELTPAMAGALAEFLE